MIYSKVLSNRNEISSETTCKAYYPERAGKFGFKIVLSGQEQYQIGRRVINIYPGTFFCINEGTSYSRKIESDVPVNSFSVSFDKAFLYDFQVSMAMKAESCIDFPFCRGTDPFYFMEAIYPFQGDFQYSILHLKKHLDAGVNDEMLLTEYLRHCLLTYSGIYNREIVCKSESLNFLNQKTKVEILKRLTVAKDYIISHYNQELKLQDIAAVSCLSVNHLLRTFKQAYQISPYQFLLQCRLDRAQYLLKNKQYSVNEVVEIVGFECPSSFIKMFKSNFGLTPGKYRENL